jgi:MYXO-CTERM domain-containing protein
MFVSEPRAEAYCRSTTCTGDCPRDENDCKTTGNELYWPSSCVGISLQKDGGAYVPFKYFEQAAQKALVEWSDVPCDSGTATISFSQLDNVACDDAEYNDGGTNSNAIVFQDTKWEYTSVDNNLAKTTVTFDADTGEILDADIEINQANNDFTVSDETIEFDLQSILTHEVGHLIGLDHSPDPDATMYATYEMGTTDQRSIEADDIDAVCAIYPPGRKASCSPQPRGGLGIDCGGVANSGDGGDGEGGGCQTSPGAPSHREALSWATLFAAALFAGVRSRRHEDGRMRRDRATRRQEDRKQQHERNEDRS